MEDVDEEFRTRVEYASKAFADRISAAFETLVDPGMEWLNKLPEYQKLQTLTGRLDDEESDQVSNLDSLISGSCHFLRQYVRSRIFCVLLENNEASADGFLDPTIAAKSQYYNDLNAEQRILTKTFWRRLGKGALKDDRAEDTVFDQVTNQGVLMANAIERVSIAQLRKLQQDLDEALTVSSESRALPKHQLGEPYQPTDKSEDHVVEAVSLVLQSQKYQDGTSAYWSNSAVLLSNADKEQRSIQGLTKLEEDLSGLPIRTKKDHHELAPGDSSSAGKVQTVSDEIVDGSGSGSSSNTTESQHALPYRLNDAKGKSSNSIKQGDVTIPATTGLMTLPQPPKVSATPSNTLSASSSLVQPIESGNVVITDSKLRREMPLLRKQDSTRAFCVSTFVHQASEYLNLTCHDLLANNVSFDPALTDTLLCLEDRDFKYLPLWAGGDDDGSGGVFDPSIPNAEVGPTGPGPKFHTGSGLSTRTTSEFSLIDGSDATSSVNTSLAVDDGHSHHIDRRKVVSAATTNSNVSTKEGWNEDEDEMSLWRVVMEQKQRSLESVAKDGYAKDEQKARAVDEFCSTFDDDFTYDDASEEGEDMQWDNDNDREEDFDFASAASVSASVDDNDDDEVMTEN
ncbi:MAG: hypothetical protein M1837_003191 [Sclerophora amabilis]|nr:MAG: hypothetical protein M1837_003191 [Sclerophora amabilis]